MKRLFLLSGLMLAASALTGCGKDDAANLSAKGADVRIEASLPESRTDIGYADGAYTVNWKTGDNIYVSAYTEAEKGGDTWTWGKPYKTNAPRTYTFDGTQFAMPENGHVPAGTYTFTAVYTNKSQATYPDTNKLSEKQTQDCNAPTAHLAEYDCLIGSSTATLPDAQPAFTMKRVYTWMKITVKNSTGAAKTVQSLEFSSNANLAGIYDLDFAAGTANFKSGGQNSITVTLENAPELAAGATQDVYFVMAPHTYNGEATITVNTADGETFTETRTINTTFAAGAASSATFEMTAAAAPDVYELVTADGAFADGGEYLIAIKSGVADEYWFLIPGTTGANLSAMNELTVAADNTVSTANTKYTWTAEANDTGFALCNDEGTYITYTGSGTNLVTKGTLNPDRKNGLWIPTFIEGGYYKLQYQSTSGRFFGVNAGPAAMKAYANSNFTNQFNPASALKQNCGALSVFRKKGN